MRPTIMSLARLVFLKNPPKAARSPWQKSLSPVNAGETACATIATEALTRAGGAGIQPAGLLPRAAGRPPQTFSAGLPQDSPRWASFGPNRTMRICRMRTKSYQPQKVQPLPVAEGVGASNPSRFTIQQRSRC